MGCLCTAIMMTYIRFMNILHRLNSQVREYLMFGAHYITSGVQKFICLLTSLNAIIIAEIEKHIVTAHMYNELSEKLRRERIDFEFIFCENKFESDDKSAFAMGYRLIGLQEMISMTSIGIYPKLLADKQRIGENIEEYLEILRTVK